MESVTAENTAVGNLVKINGYYTPNDGGDAVYEVVAASSSPWDVKIGENKFLSIRNTDFVSYRMFGAKLDGVADDEIPIQNTHAYANANGVKVKNHKGIIYKASPNPIPVMYDVDLSGSTILVKNENSAFRAWYKIGNNTGMYYSLNFTEEQKAQLKEGSSYFTMLDNSIPANIAIKLKETNHAARDDAGNVYLADRAELMVHDMHGICSGPLIENWHNAGGRGIAAGETNAATVFSASYTPIPTTTLTFTGCDVDISTTDNVSVNVLNITRHNTVVKNFTIRPFRNSMRNNVTFKNAVFYAEDCYNLIFENILGFNIAGRNNGSIKATSGYMLRLSTCMKVTVHNCRLNGYWGATAGENVKDVHFENIETNRLDIHNYFRDLFISNCTLHNHGVQIGYGKGLVLVSGCAFVFQNIQDYSHMNNLVSLNSTYGKLFSGMLVVENAAIDAYQTGKYVNLLACEMTPNASCVSDSPYRLPDIRFRNITARLYESGYGLRLLSFDGRAPETLRNMTLASFEDICANSGVIAIYAGDADAATAGTSSISIKNVVNADASLGGWFGRSGNVKPALIGEELKDIKKEVDGKVGRLATRLTASDDMNNVYFGGYYIADWNTANNPDNTQGFLHVMPTYSEWSNSVQIFVAASTGNVKIRTSFWDSNGVLQWNAWRGLSLS